MTREELRQKIEKILWAAYEPDMSPNMEEVSEEIVALMTPPPTGTGEKEGKVTGYMQMGQITECGNCHPEKYEDCAELHKKYPHLSCNCKCHTPSPEWGEWEERFRKWFDSDKDDWENYNTEKTEQAREEIISFIRTLLSSALSSQIREIREKIVSGRVFRATGNNGLKEEVLAILDSFTKSNE